MAIQRESPYIWATWLARIWAGSAQCHWRYWFQTHHKLKDKRPSSFDSVTWQMKHSRLLTEVRMEVAQRGVRPRIEFPFQIKVPKWNALVAGKIDCLIQEGRRVTVLDCKTGSPRESDQVQVMIYMYALSQDPRFAGSLVHGRVVYRNQHIDIPELPSGFADEFEYFVGVLAGDAPAVREAGQDCTFCNITDLDCPDRLE